MKARVERCEGRDESAGRREVERDGTSAKRKEMARLDEMGGQREGKKGKET